jgi:hypothetical protein
MEMASGEGGYEYMLEIDGNRVGPFDSHGNRID